MNRSDEFPQDAMQADQAMHGEYEEWLRDEAAQAGYCQWLTSLETKPTSGGNGNKAKTCSVKNVASKTLVNGILPNILTRSSIRTRTVKIHEMMESKYLKKEEVGEDGTIVTIESFAQVNVSPEDKPEELKWSMRTREFDKSLIINTTNLKLCEQIFGSDDTDDWIGKQCILYNDPNITFGNKLTGGIRVKAHRKVAPPRQINKPSQSIVRNKLPADDDPGYDPTAFSSPDDLLEVR